MSHESSNFILPLTDFLCSYTTILYLPIPNTWFCVVYPLKHFYYFMCIPGALRGEKRVSDPKTEVTDGCKSTCGCWEWILPRLREQHVLLTTPRENSLSPASCQEIPVSYLWPKLLQLMSFYTVLRQTWSPQLEAAQHQGECGQFTLRFIGNREFSPKVTAAL